MDSFLTLQRLDGVLAEPVRRSVGAPDAITTESGYAIFVGREA
ncbi:MAG: hypothetical protein AAF566_04910 [Pseudomonadota bacterium]